MLFTKEFLDELQNRMKGLDVIGYIMISKNKTFHDAILEISEFFQMKPEYIEKKIKENG